MFTYVYVSFNVYSCPDDTVLIEEHFTMDVSSVLNCTLDFCFQVAYKLFVNFKLVVDDKALAQLAKDGYDPAFGARPVKRAIQRELENPIAKNIIAGKYLPGAEIKVTAKNGAIVV